MVLHRFARHVCDVFVSCLGHLHDVFSEMLLAFLLSAPAFIDLLEIMDFLGGGQRLTTFHNHFGKSLTGHYLQKNSSENDSAQLFCQT